jgi:hypothetical protein
MGTVPRCTPHQALEYSSVKLDTVITTQALRQLMPSTAPIQNYLLIYIFFNDRKGNIVFIYEDNKTDKRQPCIMACSNAKQTLLAKTITFICEYKEVK